MASAMKTKKEIKKRLDVIKSVLTLIKGKLSPPEYNHVKRLMTDGTERDLIFIQGLSTGIELAVLDADELKIIIKILRDAKLRSNDGRLVFSKQEIETMDEILEHKFPLAARRKIMAVIARADSLLLDGLIDTLGKAL